jgi:hypothetical protein
MYMGAITGKPLRGHDRPADVGVDRGLVVVLDLNFSG